MALIHATRRPVSVLRSFLTTEASGGILLIGAAALALALANSPASAAYFAVLHSYIGPVSVLHWINDGLMAVFFFLVGLEIKREFVDGNLSRPADRRLPLVAAVSGMLLPAAIYLSLVGSTSPLARGWAIPAATDIAFALGILALLGKRAPASLKLFLTAVAVIDDVGAVAVIAVGYTQGINWVALGAALLILLLLLGMNTAGERRLWPFLVLSLALWMATYLSGVHATVAGMLAALAIPLTRSPGTPDNMQSPLHRLEHSLEPWVAFGILPLFGFANAGVSLSGLGLEALLSPLPLGIAASLFIGKQLGIFASVRVAVALGWGKRPRGATWLQMYGVAMLCGIGFTMSLFIGGLAFDDEALIKSVKVGVLVGSLLSAVTGFALLWFAPPRSSPRAAANVRNGSKGDMMS